MVAGCNHGGCQPGGVIIHAADQDVGLRARGACRIGGDRHWERGIGSGGIRSEHLHNGLHLVAADIGPARTVHFAQVVGLYTIRINEDKVLASQPGECRRHQ